MTGLARLDGPASGVRHPTPGWWGPTGRVADGGKRRARLSTAPLVHSSFGQFWRFSKMPAAPWPPPTHMVTMP